MLSASTPNSKSASPISQKKTGRSKSFYARAALEKYLEDLEDFFLAEERMEGVQSDDMMRKLGLEN